MRTRAAVLATVFFVGLRIAGVPETAFCLVEDSYHTLLGEGTGASLQLGDYLLATFIGYHAGYSNTDGANNVFVGDSTGSNNISGSHNSFVGDSSGKYSTGSFNTFMGREAGFLNAGDKNSFIGFQSGYNNGTGFFNAFFGESTGFNNTTGQENTFIGSAAGYYNVDGKYNTFVGREAGFHNVGGQDGLSGTYNSFLGFDAGYSNTVGYGNTFLGSDSGKKNIGGIKNTFVGDGAGYWNNDGNSGGNENTFVGQEAGWANTSGSWNTFLGMQAGQNHTTGGANVFLGHYAGQNNLSGGGNVFVGTNSGINTGNHPTADKANYNTFVGNGAGFTNVFGGGNVFIGNMAGFNEFESNRLYIANSSTASPLIYGEFDNKILKVNGTLVIGGSSVAPDALGTVRATSPAENNPVLTDPRGSDPEAGRLGSPLLLTPDKVGTLRAGKWCSSPDGVHLTCTQDPPVLAQRDSTLGEVSSRRVAASGVHVSLRGTDAGGGWLTSVADNDFWLSSGAMYDEEAGRWIQESADGKAVLVGLGEEGYQVYTLPGNAVGQPIREREARLQIDYNGNVGLGVTPQHPLHVAGGAYTDGGSWVNGSSREYKERIRDLTAEEALMAFEGLHPVTFRYRGSKGEQRVGFVAEDVPHLVATKDRKGLSSMDIVAVLTKVVQEKSQLVERQQNTIEKLERALEAMERRLSSLEKQ